MNSISEHYNSLTVLLSFLIAVTASCSALSLANKISRVNGKSQTLWLISGSCVMGVGLWSTHFVGMLACNLGVTVNYNPAITLLSMSAGITASFITFRLTTITQGGSRQVFLASFFYGKRYSSYVFYRNSSESNRPFWFSYHYDLMVLVIIIAFAACYVTLHVFQRVWSNRVQYKDEALICSHSGTDDIADDYYL